MKRRTLIAGVGGAVVTLGALAAYESVRYVVASPPLSTGAVEKPLGEFNVDPSWILSGKPVFRGAETLRSADGRSVSGLWACEGPTTFVWHFGGDETVHLLEGRVEVEYMGRRFSISPGETATFHAGTKAVWHVPSHAKKSYTLHKPGMLVRAWRKAMRLVGSGR
jgi:uncharacterized cupin superfamily protein